MLHAYNPSTQQAKAGDHIIKASLGYIMKLRFYKRDLGAGGMV